MVRLNCVSLICIQNGLDLVAYMKHTIRRSKCVKIERMGKRKLG